MRKNWTKMRRDRRADIGIGTMIVFIAMVLVAAVAAAVLISTANQVREQATSTGDQAINNVAAGFNKVSVTGKVHDASIDGIEVVTILLRLVAGSPDIKTSTIVVKTIVEGTAGEGSPVITGGTNGVIGQSQICTVTISGLTTLKSLCEMEITIIPAFGQPTYVNFMVPETLIALYDYTLG